MSERKLFIVPAGSRQSLLGISDVANVHVEIAARAFPKGGLLECLKCGNWKRVSPREIGDYLRQGWPKCCGQIVRFVA